MPNEPMTKYEWTHSRPLIRLHSDDRITPGEVFEPTEREQDAFGDRLSRVESEATSADADSGETETADGAEDTPLAEKHWRTAVSEVESGEYDDRLDELAGDEELTDSVREAVEERQAELSE